MSLATIRAAIVAKLNAIPGIGLVHSYERLASRNADLIALYTTGDQILGWLVRRMATREAYLADDATEPREEVVRWEIRGYMSLRDAEATELAFDDLIEAIRDAFRADDTLCGDHIGSLPGKRPPRNAAAGSDNAPLCASAQLAGYLSSRVKAPAHQGNR